MNILMVADTIFPDEAGGSERFVYELGSHLYSRGHKICTLTRRTSSAFHKSEIIEGMRIERFDFNPEAGIGAGIKGMINLHLLSKRLLSENKFNVIIFNQPFSNWGVNIFRKGKEIPRIYMFYAPWHIEYEIKTGKKGPGSLIRRFMEKRAILASQMAVTLSEYMKEMLVKIHQIPQGFVRIIPGGVDVEKFKPAVEKELVREKLEIPTNRFILLTVRRLVPRMGLDKLILAMNELRKEYSNIILFIGGEGFFDEYLKGLVKQLKLEEYVRFLGFVDEEKLKLFYQASDLFILPTTELEGFGLVTLEALSSGLPVLGTPVGGTVEILKKFNGDFLFKSAEVSSILERIRRYLKNGEGVKDLSIRCREFVLKNYSWEKIVKDWEAILQKAAEV